MTTSFVNSIAELKALAAGQSPCVVVLGYYFPGDEGGGEFCWDASSVDADNDGTIIAPTLIPPKGRWKRSVESPLSVKWFGCRGDVRTASDGTTLAGSTALNTQSAQFVPDDKGKWISIRGAGPRGLWITRIAKFVGPSSIELADAAPVDARGATIFVASRSVTAQDAQIWLGRTTLTSTNAQFVKDDVESFIALEGLGPPDPLITVVDSYIDSMHVKLGDAASFSVGPHSASFVWGTDDWLAIRSAVAAMPESDAVLLFPPGTYSCSGPVYLRDKNNFAVRGCGAGIIITGKTPYTVAYLEPEPFPIAYNGVSNDSREFSVLEIFNCCDWQLSGLIIDGNYSYRGASFLQHSHGIHVGGCHRFTVRSVELQYCQGDGIMLTAMNRKAFAYGGSSQPSSNCSEFGLFDLKVHNVARHSISIVGGRNGVIDGLTDCDIGTDQGNTSGASSAIHFEVDPGEDSYELCERINVSNVNCRNHAIGLGSFCDFSRLSRFITVNNFSYEHDRITLGQAPGGIWSIVVLGATTVAYDTDPPALPWPNYEPQSAHDITMSNGVIRIHPDVIKSLNDNQVECWGIAFQSSFSGVVHLVPPLEEVKKNNWGNGQFVYVRSALTGPVFHTPPGYFVMLTDWRTGTWTHLPTNGTDWTSPYNVTVNSIIIDGPHIGINGARNTKNIFITNNIIQNTSQHSLRLMGQCTVTGNRLLDVTGGDSGSFICVKDPTDWDHGNPVPVYDMISCEDNFLCYGLTAQVPNGLTYFSLDSKVTRFWANRNQCFGITSLGLYNFRNEGGSDPISFLQNKLYDDDKGFSGEFRWIGSSSVINVNNSNVTRFTNVFICPKNLDAETLMRVHGCYVSCVKEHILFTVSVTDGHEAAGTENFGYLLS